MTWDVAEEAAVLEHAGLRWAGHPPSPLRPATLGSHRRGATASSKGSSSGSSLFESYEPDGSPSYLWPKSGAMAVRLQAMRGTLAKRMDSFDGSNDSPLAQLSLIREGDPHAGLCTDIRGSVDCQQSRGLALSRSVLACAESRQEEDDLADDISLSDKRASADIGDKGSAAGSELTLNAFSHATPGKRDALADGCAQLTLCLEAAREALAEEFEPSTRVAKQEARLQQLLARIRHFATARKVGEMPEQQVDTLLCALFLLVVASDFFDAYDMVEAMHVGARAARRPCAVRMQLLSSLLPHVRDLLDRRGAGAGAMLLEAEALVADVAGGFAIPSPVSANAQPAPMLGLSSVAGCSAGAGHKVQGGGGGGAVDSECRVGAMAAASELAAALAGRGTHRCVVVGFEAVFRREVHPELVDVFSLLRAYTRLPGPFLRELLLLAVPHRHCIQDLLGGSSRGPFQGARKLFVVSAHSEEWVVPAAQLLLGPKLPAENVYCRKVHNKAEWLAGLRACTGLLPRDFLVVDACPDTVAAAQAQGCSTLMLGDPAQSPVLHLRAGSKAGSAVRSSDGEWADHADGGGRTGSHWDSMDNGSPLSATDSGGMMGLGSKGGGALQRRARVAARLQRGRTAAKAWARSGAAMADRCLDAVKHSVARRVACAHPRAMVKVQL